MEISKMKIKNKKATAIIPNVSFAFGTEYHLTLDEAYVYTHLYFMKPYAYTNEVVTMVELLVHEIGWKATRLGKLRVRVAEALTALQDKGYIGIDCEGDLKKSVLTITINKAMEKAEAETEVEWKDKPYVWKGFTFITAEQFNLINSEEEFMVLAYTIWRANAPFEYKICFKEWAAVLGIAERTARMVIARCESFLEKTSGKTIVSEGQVRQEPNSYKITATEKEVEAEPTQAPTVEEITTIPTQIPVIEEILPVATLYSGSEDFTSSLTAIDNLLEELG